MGIWFTSDTHFGHANIIKYCDRPYTSRSEMDEGLIANWNQVVSPNDNIYHLGDFTLGGEEQATAYFSRLNGKISVIPGGHDKQWMSKGEYISKSRHPVEVLSPLETIKVSIFGRSHLVVLCHYSMRVWDHSHYGSWHLYGHSHCGLSAHMKRMDVGIDCWNYFPVSLKQIAEEMV